VAVENLRRKKGIYPEGYRTGAFALPGQVYLDSWLELPSKNGKD
jgi:hypothetical protein